MKFRKLVNELEHFFDALAFAFECGSIQCYTANTHVCCRHGNTEELVSMFADLIKY